MTTETVCAECTKLLFRPADAPQMPARLTQRRILRWVCSTCASRLFTQQPALAFSCVRVDLPLHQVANRLTRSWCYAVLDPSA